MKKNKKFLFVFLSIIVAIVLCSFIVLEINYQSAVSEWEKGNYLDSSKTFDSIKFYKDSNNYFTKFENKLMKSLSRCKWKTDVNYYLDGTYEAASTYYVEFYDDFTGHVNKFFLDTDNIGPGSGYDTNKQYDFYYEFDWNDDRLCLVVTTDRGTESYGTVFFSRKNVDEVSAFMMKHGELIEHIPYEE